MGTQPNRKLAKRGPRIRSRKLRGDLKDSIKKGDFKRASSQIENAVIKSGGAAFLGGILAAGIIALAASKESPTKSPKEIAGDAITRLPKTVKQEITVSGRDTIRAAIENVLLKEGS